MDDWQFVPLLEKASARILDKLGNRHTQGSARCEKSDVCEQPSRYGTHLMEEWEMARWRGLDNFRSSVVQIVYRMTKVSSNELGLA